MNIDIVQVIHDLLRPLFKDLSTWFAWIVFLKAVFGLPMTPEESALYMAYTGRSDSPQRPFREVWAVIGRRGGKSFIAAVIAVFLALFRDFSEYLNVGERGAIQIIAADKAQAKVLLRYVKGILHSVPIFEQYIERELREGVELTNGIVIEIATASFRTVRGRTLVAAILDEAAFWRSEGQNPDREVLSAVRPAAASIPNALILVLSSPYARTGILWDQYDRYFGVENPEIIVWQAPTRTMNPMIPQSLVDRETEKDPASARAEYLAEFRDDVEGFASLEAVEACIVPGRRELAPVDGISYVGFTDPSGGSSDSFTLSVSHLDAETGAKVLDMVREIRPPFSPETATEELARDLERYRIRRVWGDRYSGEWVREAFRKNGIEYSVSPKVKSEIYGELLPDINSGQVELLDNDKLKSQLLGLERRTSSSGRDVIDHGPRQHDDVINAAAGVLVMLNKQKTRVISGARIIRSKGFGPWI